MHRLKPSPSTAIVRRCQRVENRVLSVGSFLARRATPELPSPVTVVMRPPVSRILVMLATMVLIAHGAPGVTLAAEEGTSTLTGGGTTSGPPAPAAPGVAATPEPAPKPAVPNAPLEPGVAAREEPVEAPAPAAKPRSVNLWPLFQYESDPATRKTHVSIFGPLIEYRADADRQAFFVRPLVSIDQSRVGHDDHTSFLGPLLTSDWGQTEQVTKGLGGLFTYRTRTSADGRTLEAQRARLLPIYFYDWDQTEPAGRVSVVPLYADIDDFLGYERIEMVAFPAYLRLKRPSLDRYYYPYPIISRDGPPGSGYRLWPFPLRDRQGRRVEREAGATEPERQTYFPVMRDELDATDAASGPRRPSRRPVTPRRRPDRFLNASRPSRDHPGMTRAARSAASAASSRPASRSTASVCSPSRGDGPRGAVDAPANPTGLATPRSMPPSRVGTSTKAPAAAACGSCDDLVERLDGRPPHAFAIEARGPLGERTGRERAVELGDRRAAVPAALARGREARIGEQVLALHAPRHSRESAGRLRGRSARTSGRSRRGSN